MSSPGQFGGPVERFALREDWEAYRDQLSAWLRTWEHENAQMLTPHELSEHSWLVANTRWEAHPVFKGSTVLDIWTSLRRQAREAQARYRLMSTLPSTTPAEEFIRAVLGMKELNNEWCWSGGEKHTEMAASELEAHFRRCAKGEGSDWWQLDFMTLVVNRLYYEYQREYRLRGASRNAQDYSANQYVKDLVEGTRFPNETNAAKYLRKTWTPASLVIVVAAVSYFIGVPHAGMIAGIALLYLVSAHLLYPSFVGVRWVKRD